MKGTSIGVWAPVKAPALLAAATAILMGCNLLSLLGGSNNGGQAAAPEYVVGSASMPSSGMTSGTITGSFDITNLGSGDGQDSISWKVLMSTDTKQDPSDTMVSNGSINPLKSGASSSNISISGNWPATAGSYYLIIVIAAQDDSKTSDNQKVSSAVSVSSPPPSTGIDYVISSTSFPSNGTASGSVSGSFAITNAGDTNGQQSVSWTVYASADTIQDSSDAVVQTGSISALNAGGTSSTIIFSGSWPSTVQTYYLIVVISASDETKTTNDQSVSPAITVSTATSVSGVDYVVNSPTFPSSGYSGGPISGTFSIKNQGTAAGSATITWAVYQSADAIYNSASDVQLASGTLTALGGGVTSSTIAYSGSWDTTMGAGSYYLLIVLSASDDVNGSNNTSASTQAITVAPAYVDLAVTAATFPSSTASVASAISGSFTVTNQGNIAQTQATTWTVYRSPNLDPANLTSDTSIASGTLSQLNAGASQNVNFTGFWPAIPGTYYLKIILTISDNNSSNDYRVSTAVTVNALSATFYALEDYSNPTIWKTTDGGYTWASVSTPGLVNAGGSGAGIASDGTGNLVIGGYSSAAYSADSGQTWQASSGPGTGDIIHDVSTDRKGTWVAVGNLYLGATSGSTKAVVSTDNGATWTKPTGTISWGSGELYSVATDGTVWVAVGQYGEIYRSTAPGTTWTQVSAPSTIQFTSITTDGAGHWVAAGRNTTTSTWVGVIFYSADGGQTFTQDQTALSPTNDAVASVATDKKGTWIAVATDPNVSGGGLSYISTDNGASWTQGGSFNVDFGPFTGDEGGVATDGAGVWVVAGHGTNKAYYSVDNGSHWNPGSVSTAESLGGGLTPY